MWVHDRGMTAAQVDWVAILNAPSISWEFPERPERPETKPSIVREMVTAGAISQQDADGFASQNIVWRDEVWTDAAIHILRTHRPNLLLFHLLALDSMQHRYGPKTPAAMVTMARLDSQVGRVLNALDDAGMTARTTLFCRLGPRFQGRAEAGAAKRCVERRRPYHCRKRQGNGNESVCGVGRWLGIHVCNLGGSRRRSVAPCATGDFRP
jgi:hypothetical protein